MKQKKDHKLSQETYRAWEKIFHRLLHFDKREKEAEAVKKLTKQDLLDFYHTYISKKATKRRKLVVHIFGNQHPMEKAGQIGPTEVGEDHLVDEIRNNIENVTEWKRQQPLLPSTPY